LQAVGFSDNAVLWFVLAESLLIAVCGGAIGLGLGHAFTAQGDPTGFFPAFYIPVVAAAMGALIILATGLLAGLLPALSARRLSVIEALRRL
jgi:putative ABC transport system permease protein